jgi:hypothetical protein
MATIVQMRIHKCTVSSNVVPSSTPMVQTNKLVAGWVAVQFEKKHMEKNTGEVKFTESYRANIGMHGLQA